MHFRSSIGNLQKSCGIHARSNKNSYTVSRLISQFRNENNTFGLEILELLQHFLKMHLDKNEEATNMAIVYLLTNDKSKFLYTNNPEIKQIFQECPFTELQKLVQLAQHLKDELPANFQINQKASEMTEQPVRCKPVEKIIEESFSPPFGTSACVVEEAASKLDGNTWLRQRYDENQALMPGLSFEDFSSSIKQMLSSKKSDEELQNELIEMLGFDLFELAGDILCNRQTILTEPDPSQTENETQAVQEIHFEPKPSDLEMPFELQTLEAVCKRITTNENILSMGYEDEVTNNGASELSNEEFARILMEENSGWADRGVQDWGHQNAVPETIKISDSSIGSVEDNIHDGMVDVRRKMLICGQVSNVPFDAVIRKRPLYEEIYIPPRQLDKPKEAEDERVQVESLDSIGRMVFKDIQQFNLIQSRVFDVAYNTNENMLICAPTGSGKTNIALLTIVSQVKKFIDSGVLHLNKFKVVYICPMKALAAEMTRNFGRKLACLGITVKELTGDMQLSRKEIQETQMLVTTPEKWDVVTRKGTADAELTSLVKLLVIDEVHLLNSDRGHVIEALVARTLRQVISSQSMIRIVGLSATLPSYRDVSDFLRVNPEVGLFYFDNAYRSVPLAQSFIGVEKSNTPRFSNANLDEVCYEKVVEFLKNEHQVLVFVHARNETVRTANFLKDTASKMKQIDLFAPPNKMRAKKMKRELETSTSRAHLIEELLQHGIGIHHAGMMRDSRSATERHFMDGSIRVLVCTATLAWGVNLPAHGVIIKGTDIYDSKQGKLVNLDILDVLQIFGRAGRPQFDKMGHGIIVTEKTKIHFYLSSLTNQLPIESSLAKSLPDNLNAEIVLGTIRNVQEAVEWLTFTYMYRRMRANPHVYGLLPKDLENDPLLREHLLELIHNAASQLDAAHMIRYDVKIGDLVSTHLGRTASYFYINLYTIQNFNERLNQFMTEEEIIAMMCFASEFSDMQVRQDELEALDGLLDEYADFGAPGGVENITGKVCVLMQTYLSRGNIKVISLASDMEFIIQSTVRIARALFDIAIHQNYALLAGRCLAVAQAFEQQMWPHELPLRQCSDIPLSFIQRMESIHISMQNLQEMDTKNLEGYIRNHRHVSTIKRFISSFPYLETDSTLHPITRGVLRVHLFVTPKFTWNDKINGKACENFWLWVEDPENDTIYHSESLAITKAVCMKDETLQLVFTVHLAEPRPSQYLVRISSDRWMHCVYVHPLSFRDLHVPTSFTPHTELLELRPLPVSALNNPLYESMYKFSHFNPVQTQIFHCLYHKDNNVLLGAPTGSGKTIAAEICVFRLFNKNANLKAVYIAPMKALVRERIDDWKSRFGQILGKYVVEITGDITPSMQALKKADIIITTPEKWDGLSRGWQTRQYVQQVGLVIIDEIHLLGEDRGPVLEVIVSRTNFIANETGMKPRVVGLSTAMANAGDLGNWLGIQKVGLYNFRPSVRPVPLDAHIVGFPEKYYCPRMLSMNRPAYQAIRQFAPTSPVLIFCSSRKQTRLTAIDLITCLLIDPDTRKWLHCEDHVMEYITATVTDPDLKHFLTFGIGIHHAGLQEKDRKTVEELFVNQKIQVLIATATLAWGVNFPAHLVIIKGTEYFDGKTKRYVDMPITDVLQMMGRAGRPQFDSSGVACIYVHDVKKNFYKKFLYEPFPIESNLVQVLPDHINAEIASGTIPNKTKLMEYMTWTYFYRRLLENPSYYNKDLKEIEPGAVREFISALVDAVISVLVDSNCVAVDEDGEALATNYSQNPRQKYRTTLYGEIASFYYLSHKTMVLFQNTIKWNSTIMELIDVACRSTEYSTFPVRHNEDKINRELAELISLDLKGESYELPHVKVALLIHTYLGNYEFPNQEYTVDFKSVVDQAIRILQAMIDIATNESWLSCTLKIIHIMQMLVQGQYLHLPVLLTIPGVNEYNMQALTAEIRKHSIILSDNPINLLSLKLACLENRRPLDRILTTIFDHGQSKKILQHISSLPLINWTLTIPKLDMKFSKDEPQTLTLKPNVEYEFILLLDRLSSSSDLKVQAPRFPKTKDEGWFICLGDTQHDYLICIKKMTVFKHSTCTLTFIAPNPGKYVFSLFFVSDSYLGLDQHYDIHVNVEE